MPIRHTSLLTSSSGFVFLPLILPISAERCEGVRRSNPRLIASFRFPARYFRLSLCHAPSFWFQRANAMGLLIWVGRFWSFVGGGQRQRHDCGLNRGGNLCPNVHDCDEAWIECFLSAICMRGGRPISLRGRCRFRPTFDRRRFRKFLLLSVFGYEKTAVC